jgi:hypothetical protein
MSIEKEDYAAFKRLLNLIGEYDRRAILFRFSPDMSSDFSPVYDYPDTGKNGL